MKHFLCARWFHFAVLFCVLMFFAVTSFSDSSWRESIRNWTFDTYNKAYPSEVSDQVVIIDIDERSIQAIGQMPWPRTRMGDLVEKLADLGAAVTVFDIVFPEPDRTSPMVIAEGLEHIDDFGILLDEVKNLPDNDEVFSWAIRDAGNVVTGFSFGRENESKAPQAKTPLIVKGAENFLRGLDGAASNLRVLTKHAAGNGSFFVSNDGDGIIRRVPMIVEYKRTSSNFKSFYPALAIEAVRVFNQERGIRVKMASENITNNNIYGIKGVQIGKSDLFIPTNKRGEFLVHFAEAKPEWYISALDVLNGTALKDDIEGKIVLIGTSAVGLKDIRSTPLDAFRPGVEVHLNIINQILTGEFLHREVYAELMEAVFIAVIGLSIIILLPLTGVVMQVLLTLATSALAIYTGVFAYTEYGILIDVLYPLIAIACLFVLSLFLTYLRTEADRKQVRDAFGHYISPDFMKELTSNPERLKLGGEIRDLSVMFTDIRSFTTISEGLTPQELIQLMNDFLTPMSDLVMSNKGTIDKYMGDAMMAFWNAPLDDKDHARHACIAALGMQEALHPINEEVKRKCEEIGKDPILLQAGIGINTGPCAVGNMGSRQRFAYSTLGDAVNLASRLEGQTKNYGASILIGYETWKNVQDFAVLEFDLIQVKGKTKPERIYGLLGNEDMAAQDSFQKLQGLHEQMIEAYRSKDFAQAETLIKKCSSIKEFDLSALYGVYRERIKSLKKKKLPKEWDGVFVATSK